MATKVGIVGLGIMGRAFAANLLAAGFEVSGFDTDQAALDWLRGRGGAPCRNAAEVGESAQVAITALASPAALEESLGPRGLAATFDHRCILIETGTFPIDLKERCAAPLIAVGARALDCPVSGTGAQAKSKDLVVFASGPEADVERVRPILDGFARKTLFLGPFGAGMKMKCIANHLVTIHNLAAAEALHLAVRCGLDRMQVYEAVCGGAGSSRMFEVRGPLMAAETYEPPTMKFDVYIKDLDLIHDVARRALAPTPLFDAAIPYYYAALAQGRAKQDTAALYGVLKMLAGGEDAR